MKSELIFPIISIEPSLKCRAGYYNKFSTKINPTFISQNPDKWGFFIQKCGTGGQDSAAGNSTRN
jgi:hypothetical protein